MKRALAVAAALAAVLAANASAASPGASCVGLVTSWEATTFEAGSVGSEVSGLAAGGQLGSFVRELAQAHAGSLAGCAA